MKFVSIIGKIRQAVALEFIRDSFWWAQSNFAVEVIAFVPSLIIRNILGPAIYGRVALVDIVAQYCGYPSSLLRSGMDRGVPQLKGEGKLDDALRLQSTTLMASLLFALFVSLGVFVASFWLTDHLTRLAARLWAMVQVTQSLTSYFKIYFRTEMKFRIIGMISLRYALITAFFNVFMTMQYGLKGLYCSSFATGLMLIVECYYRVRKKLSFCLSIPDLKYAVSKGMPLLLIGIMAINFGTVDRIFVAKYYDAWHLGAYTLVNTVTANFGLLANSVGGVFFPKIFMELSGGNTKSFIKQRLMTRAQVISFMAGLISGTVWFFLPCLFLIVPKFSSALFPARAILAGCYFSSVSYLFILVLLGLGRTPAVFLSYLVATAVAYVCMRLSYPTVDELLYVAVSMNFGNFIMLLLTFSFALSSLGTGLAGKAIQLFRILKPLLYSVGSVFIADAISNFITKDLIISSMIGLALFSAIYVLLVDIFDRGFFRMSDLRFI